jgi:hypothetical protein
VTQSTSSATTFGTSTAPFGTSTAPFHNSTAPFDTSTAPFRAPTIPFAASATTSNAASLVSTPIRDPTQSFPVILDEAEEAEEAAVDAEADGYELDAGDISDEDQANLIEEVLHDSDDEEDDTATSAVEASADCLDMRWDYTVSLDVLQSFHNSPLHFVSPLIMSTSRSFQIWQPAMPPCKSSWVIFPTL